MFRDRPERGRAPPNSKPSFGAYTAASRGIPLRCSARYLQGLRTDVTRASDDADVLDMLSPRERDVLRRMLEGKHGRDIAQDLVISTGTVRVARAVGLNMQESPG